MLALYSSYINLLSRLVHYNEFLRGSYLIESAATMIGHVLVRSTYVEKKNVLSDSHSLEQARAI